MIYTPDVFVAREGQQVDGCEVCVYGHKVERQQDRQDFHDQPHQRWAGLNSQQLRREPEACPKWYSLYIFIYCVHHYLLPSCRDAFQF